MMKWYLYIVKASDDTLYTGITTNIAKRLFQHNSGKGAKCLRGKLPVELVYNEEYRSCSEARKREEAIKNWTRKNKLKLIGSKGSDKKRGFAVRSAKKETHVKDN